MDKNKINLAAGIATLATLTVAGVAATLVSLAAAVVAIGDGNVGAGLVLALLGCAAIAGTELFNRRVARVAAAPRHQEVAR